MSVVAIVYDENVPETIIQAVDTRTGIRRWFYGRWAVHPVGEEWEETEHYIVRDISYPEWIRGRNGDMITLTLTCERM